MRGEAKLGMLFQKGGGPNDDEGWRRVAEILVQELGQFMGQQLDLVDDLDVGNGFSADITSRREGSRLEVTWRGIVGVDIVSDSELPRGSATLFPYILGVRVAPRGDMDYVLLEYVEADSSEGTWRLAGWEMDEHDEYDYFDNPAS